MRYILIALCLTVIGMIYNINENYEIQIGSNGVEYERRYEDLPTNLEILKEINYQGFVEEPIYNPTICVVEGTEDKESVEHKDYVINIIEDLFYKGAEHIEFKDWINDLDAYTHCDVTNASFFVQNGITDKTFEKLESFFENYSGILVASSSNNPELKSEIEQTFIEVRNALPQYEDQIIIVGEGVINDKQVQYSDVSYGDEVDIIAPSEWIRQNGKHLSGTSFSTPMITGAIAQILQLEGKTDAKTIKEILLSTEHEITQEKNDEVFTYNVLDMNVIY